MNEVKIDARHGITGWLIGPKSDGRKLLLSNTANKRNFIRPELTLNWTGKQCLISWRNRQLSELGAPR